MGVTTRFDKVDPFSPDFCFGEEKMTRRQRMSHPLCSTEHMRTEKVKPSRHLKLTTEIGKRIAPLIIAGEIARKMHVFSVLSGVPAQTAAEFLLGRSAEQLLDPEDTFGHDMAEQLFEEAGAKFHAMLCRPPGLAAWREMLELVA